MKDTIELISNNWETLVIPAISLAIIAMVYARPQTWMDRLRLTLFLTMLPALAVVVWFTNGFWANILLVAPSEYYQLGILPLFLFIYLMLSYASIYLAAYIKKGFGNLKKSSEFGLRLLLPLGLSVGTFIGAGGTIVVESMTGVIGSFLFGTALGFIISSGLGWLLEFSKKEPDA